MNGSTSFLAADRTPSAARSRRSLLLVTIAALGVDVIAACVALTSIWGTRYGLRLVTCLLILVLIAGQREVIFGDQSALNGSMIVLVAAAGAYVGGAPLWVPLTCGLLGGLNWDHLRGLELRKLVVNAACTTLAAVTAAELARLAYQASAPRWLASIVSAAIAGGVYWFVDNGAVAIVLAAVDGKPAVVHARELIRSETLLVPFALAGFLAGYYALHGIAIWTAALIVFALLAIADVFVISPRTQALIVACRRLLTLMAVGLPLLGIGLGVAEGGTPSVPRFLVLVLLVVLGSLVLDRMRHGAGMLFVLAIVAVTCIAFRSSAPVLTPLVVGAIGALSLATARRERWRDVEQLLLASAAIVGTAAGIQTEVGPSLVFLIVTGVAMATAGAVGWHMPPALELRLRTGPTSWIASLDAVRADIGPCFAIGVIVGLIGWVGLQIGVGGLAALLLVGGLGVTAATGRQAPPLPRLSEDDLTDLVQSALLDLPASRLPDRS